MRTWLVATLLGVCLLILAWSELNSDRPAAEIGLMQQADASTRSEFAAVSTPAIQEAAGLAHAEKPFEGVEVGPFPDSLAFLDSSLLKRSAQTPAPDEIRDLVYEALTAQDPGDRSRALSLLGGSEPTRRVLQACYQGLFDEDDNVRLTAVLAFDDLKDPSALDLLLLVANRDPNSEVREIALDVYDSLATHAR